MKNIDTQRWHFEAFILTNLFWIIINKWLKETFPDYIESIMMNVFEPFIFLYNLPFFRSSYFIYDIIIIIVHVCICL